MNIGDRAVNKINGKHGVIESIVRPVQIGTRADIKFRFRRDDGGIDLERPHNFCEETMYKKPEVETWESTTVINGADISQLTPKKTTKKQKGKVENPSNANEVVDDIINAGV